MFQNIREKLKANKIIYSMYQVVKPAVNLLRQKSWMMKYGERKEYHPFRRENTHYFVLRRYEDINGLASDLLVFLGQFKYMEENYKGYQPIIDMQSYPQEISETMGELGNAWEDFFLQPSENHFGLQELRKSKHIVMANSLSTFYELPSGLDYQALVRSGWDRYWRYIVLRPDLEERFLSDWESLVPDKAKVIGVKARGTDYAYLKPKNHNVQPTVEQVMEKLDEFLAKHEDYKYIFLSTEDANIYNKFSEIYQSKVLSVGNQRIDHYVGGAVLEQRNTEGMTKRELTMQYLEEMFLLSKCDSLLCGITSSLIPTLLWNGGRYEETYVFDLGKY